VAAVFIIASIALASGPPVAEAGVAVESAFSAEVPTRDSSARTKIADKAIRVLRETEELAEMARAQGRPLHGELRMGVIPTIAPFLLPTMLPRLRSQWPELKLYLREETSGAACEALHRGQLDCVLLALPFGCGEVDSTPLFDDPLFVAYPHGEAPAAPSVDAADIDESRLLLLEDGHCLKDHALSACNRPELRANAAMMGTSLHTLVQMVDNGLGLTFVPGMAIEAGILSGTAVDALPLRSECPYRSIALIWRRSSPREGEFKLLAETLRRIVGDLVPAPTGLEAPALEPA